MRSLGVKREPRSYPVNGGEEIIARLHGPFPSGSHVAISHATADAVAGVADAARVFDRATERAYVRTGPEIAKLVVGLDTVEPGLVWTPDWRPGARTREPRSRRARGSRFPAGGSPESHDLMARWATMLRVSRRCSSVGRAA